MWESIKKRRILLNILGIILMYFLFFWVGKSMLENYTKHNQTLSVPDLRGLPFDRVKETLQNKDLKFVIIDSSYNGKKAALTIIEQSPAPNAKVKEGRTIYLTVNARIAPKTKMPDLKDASLKQAQMMLETAGLNVGKLIYKPDLALNAVLDQVYNGNHIDANTPIKKGSTIDLVLGDGLGKSDMQVPICVGSSLSTAQSLVEMYNLNVGTITADNTVMGDTMSAIVYKQIPDVGTTIHIGQKIDLFITKDRSKVIGTDQ